MLPISSVYAALLLFAATTASAQTTVLNIIPTAPSGSFPPCATACSVLVQAELQCEPPTAGTSNNLQYENCFCQNPALASLYQSGAICDSTCTSASDQAGLFSWFAGFCQQVGAGIDPIAAANPSSTLVTVTSTSIPSSTSSTPEPTITGSGSSSDAAPSSNKSWISRHWQWILMVGILIIGFILLAWLAVFLKRRHRRKVDQRRAAVSGFPNQSEKRDGARAATPELWGPHQHMAATKGWEYHLNQGGAARNGEEDRHERKRSKRERRTPSDVAEIGSRPTTSRQTSSRGKGKGRVHTSELASRSPDAFENRSRSHTRRKREREKEPGVRGRIDDDEITPKE